MAITRTHGRVTILCDECGDHFDTLEKDFQVALQVSKENGWQVVQTPKGVSNICSDCDEIEPELDFDGQANGND